MVEEAVQQESGPVSDEMIASYKTAIERALPRIPVKNGVIDIDSIWIETSIPYELLQEVLRREDLELPENVERINLKSRVEKSRVKEPGAERGGRRGSRKRRRKR